MAVLHFRSLLNVQFICWVCRKPFATNAEILQHLRMRNCVDPKRCLRVQLQRLTKLQLLALKSPTKEVFELPIDEPKLHFNNDEMHKPQITQITCLDDQPIETPPEPIFCSSFLETLECHNLNTLECQLCGSVLKNDVSFQSHIQRHKTPTVGLVNCLYRGCKKTFLENALKEHSQQHKKILKESWFECDDCGKFLPTEALLASHRSRHSSLVKDGHLKCVYGGCTSLFVNSAELKKHVADEHQKIHSQYFCSKCGQCFPSSFSLEKHMHGAKQDLMVKADSAKWQ